jgi:hypothetical protein
VSSGLYDGVTGVVRIPYLEVNDSGISALPKGLARGFGGLFLKPMAGLLGLGSYTARGVYSNIRRRVRDTEKTERWIRRARIAQGQRETQDVQKRNQTTPSTKSDINELRNKALQVWKDVEKDKTSEQQAKQKRHSSIPGISKIRAAQS